MDSDEVCNEFHLRMTVVTTEHERFEQLLSVLVPTPDTVVSPSNLEAINDARNIVVEAIGAVCDAYGRLDDCDDIDPDEARVMDDALATVQRWHEEIDQVMVQIRQVVWDSQHGHIRRLISGTHRRSGKRKVVEEADTGCVEHAEETVGKPTEESVEVEEEPEEDVPESEDEEPEDIVLTSEEEEAVGESVGSEEEPTPEPVPEPATEEPASEEVPQTIPEEVYEKIRKEALNEGYAKGMQAALAQIAEVRKADETADEIAAESKPLGRRPRTSKPKTEKSETGEKPPKKGRGILRKKEVAQ